MIEPKCRYFGKCGGCSAQHIDYSIQLENKKKQAVNLLKFSDVHAFYDAEYGYRNRMDMIFHPNGIGLRAKGQWNNIIDIENCAIANEKINQLIREIRDFFKNPDFFNVNRNSGTFRYAVIRAPQNDSSISFVLNADSSRIGEAIDKIKEFSTITSANNLVVTYVSSKTDESVSNDFFAVKGSDKLNENLLGKDFKYSVQGFFQNNSMMAEKMHRYCNDILSKQNGSGSTLIDLYGGVGTFGIINSSFFKRVVIIEEVKECIDAAKENIQLNGIQNTEALVMDAKYLKKLDIKPPVTVITDPPRSGMNPKTIEELNKLNAERIIYISCNLQQLSKDIVKLKNHKINQAALFDLFPQTPHIETIVELILVKR